MTRIRIFLVVAAAMAGCLTLAGCDALTSAIGREPQVWIVTAPPDAPARTQALVAERVERFTVGWAPSVTASATGSIEVTLYGHSKDAKATAEALTAPGVLTCMIDGDSDTEPQLLFDDRDVVQARVSFDASGDAMLQIRLGQEAGERVLEQSAENVGRTATITVDGEVIADPKIMGPFGSRLQLNQPGASADEVWAIAAVLGGPRLPPGLTARLRD